MDHSCTTMHRGEYCFPDGWCAKDQFSLKHLAVMCHLVKRRSADGCIDDPMRRMGEILPRSRACVVGRDDCAKMTP